MSKIGLRQLECFRALATEGSFFKAARLLGITAAAVHQHVANLQHVVESPPFSGDRLYKVVDSHHISITPYGLNLIELADAVLGSIEDFTKKSLDIKIGTVIRVASPESVATYALPKVAQKLRESFPGISMRILSRHHAEIPLAVLGGDADVGIMQQANLPGNLLFKEWHRFDTFLLVPINHPILKTSTVCLEMLAHELFILPRPISPGSTRIIDGLRNAGLEVKAVVETTSYECAKRCVSMGMGLAFACGIGITEEDKSRFRAVSVSHIVGEYVYGVILRRKQSLSIPERVFLDVMGLDSHSK